MIETDKIDNIETWWENTGTELIKLKKEMVGHVVDKMK